MLYREGVCKGEVIDMNLDELLYKRAEITNVPIMLNIIHRCMNEVNYKDYSDLEFQKHLHTFTPEWLVEIILLLYL